MAGGVGHIGTKASKEAMMIVEVIVEAGLSVGQARSLLREVEALIEGSPASRNDGIISFSPEVARILGRAGTQDR
jgi:hypothetical protein